MYKVSLRSSKKSQFVRIALCIMLLAVAFLIAPTKTFARDLSINKVDIDATVQKDGTMHVVETRTFYFKGSFHGVYWNLPVGKNKYNGQDVKVNITSVTVQDSQGTRQLYSKDSSGSSANSDEYYVSSQSSDMLNLKIYSAHDDEPARITIEYDITNVVTSWSDTAELYWKFVSDGWDSESQDVTATIHLPVPAGQSIVAGDTVRAWGHGPLDANVEITNSAVVYKVPGVGTNEFAEARITFPTDWVSGLAPIQQNKMNSILSEEQAWADEANHKREVAKIQVAFILYAPLVFAAITVVAVILLRIKYKKVMTPQFNDLYYRDVPSDDHPAVLSMLYNGELIKGDALTATLMHLSDAKYISLNKTVNTNFLGMEKSDYCLTKVQDLAEGQPSFYPGSSLSNKIDSKAMKLIFDKAGESGAINTTVTMKQIGKYASSHPEDFNKAYESWESPIKLSYAAKFGTDKISFHGKGILAALIAVDILVLAAAFIMGVMADISFSNLLFHLFILFIAGFIALIGIGSFDLMNREGVETLAKTRALRKWLTEFTNLHEAIPADVILWNRLLVMAVALGVADKVIDQLKVAMPELFNDPMFMPVYSWYYYGNGMHTNAIDSVTKSVTAAHSVSTAALASSSASSGGGFGGGFSGGGGGGFGGGGGGGGF